MAWFGLLLMAAGAADIPPPPVIIASPMPPATTAQRGLLTWTPQDLRCDGSAAPSLAPIQRPLPALTYVSPRQLAPIAVRFAVDSTGRTHSITREGPAGMYWAGDVLPSLAATRFAANRPLTTCSIRYTPDFALVKDAPADALLAYSVNAFSGPLPREAWNRLTAGTDCTGPKHLQPLLRAYPDFAEVPETPGVRDWSLIRFDTDADGVPVNLAVRSGTGQAELDRASLEAVAKSRFTPGARRGCHYPYWKAAGRLTPPPSPPETDTRPVCRNEGGWEVEPALIYPPDYARRAIEGWAMIRYDIAPWGATGNVTVISAQPSADFGAAARSMIERAKATPSAAGVQGCTSLVRYVMADGGKDASQPLEAAQ